MDIMPNKALIKVVDSTVCHTNLFGAKALNDLLSYKHVFWKNTRFRKERMEQTVHLIKKWAGGAAYVFPTGFVPKCIEYLEANNIPYDLQPLDMYVEWDDPHVEGITFRPDQRLLLEEGLTSGRGVLKSFTGSGKTIIALGLMSSFSQENILFLCHTKDLIGQTADELTKFGFKDVGVYGGGKKTSGRIQLATVQTLARMDPWDYGDRFEVVLVDECHHVSSFTGQFGQVLQTLMAPVKLGLTATMPYKEEAKMALEGLIGPLLGEVSIQDGSDLGLLANPDIQILKAPVNYPMGDTYLKVYRQGIVRNMPRNKMIMNLANKLVKGGNTVLINIRAIEHGELLLACAENIGMDAYFVHGESPQQAREDIKNAIKDRNIHCVIASTVWSEGINIPSLNVCINGAGGKSEIGVLQTIGRGLRKTDNKQKVLIIDFEDRSHKWFVNHFNKRVKLYKENGWLDESYTPPSKAKEIKRPRRNLRPGRK
jgi:superfamily II DNA or RNA helicase